jgi:uncharacterized protein
VTTEVVVKNTMARIRPVLSASCVALSVGWAAAAMAGPVEDLLNAAYRGDMAAVQALLNTGTDVNARTSEICRGSFTPVCGGATALIMASFTGHLDIVQALLARGADVNAPMNNGNNALMGASRAGRVDVVRALLAKRADVNARTNNGMTALTVARNAAVEALLVQAGAKP